MTYLKRSVRTKTMTLIISIGLLFVLIGCAGATVIPDETDNQVPVTAITVTGANGLNTIDTHAGTLQLTSTITPTNATNKQVTWSVINQTGTASIDQNGLLTAVTDGTITAKAVSNDVLGLNDVLEITISNQIVDNTAPLATAIVVANQTLNNTHVGLSASDYVPGVYFVMAADHSAYLEAITSAQTILADAPLSDDAVLDAVNDLNSATDLFNESKQEGTKVVEHINLGTANDFVILSKTGISTTGTTAITGNIGLSPASASYITGFGLTMDSENAFSTSALITGMVYASDYEVDTPTYLTTAIADVMIAYTDGLSRTADYTELYTGDLSGKTLQTGVYMWSNSVLINTDVTLDGSSTDVIIFQIAGNLTMAANTEIILTGGLLPENIYWVVADTLAIGVGSSFYGVILAMTNVSMNTGSTLTGMIYAQTSVSLDATVVTKP